MIAGDALNQGLWLFNYGSLSMQELSETLQKTVELDFDAYCSSYKDDCGISDITFTIDKMN